MQRKSLTAGSWIALFIAILCWAGVALFFVMLLHMQSERVAYVKETAEANLQEGQAAALRVLARETEDDRKMLETAVGVDLLSAVSLIESVNASGTVVHVTSAQPIKTATKSDALQVNTVDLSVQAEGPFSAVVRIAQMIETLPLATTIQQMNISRPSVDLQAKNNSATWTLNIRLRFYTSVALPS